MFFDTVADLLNRKRDETVLSVSPHVSVARAVCQMNHHDVGAILVIEGTELVGLLTERDLLNKMLDPGFDPHHVLVRDLMNPHPMTLRCQDSATAALDLMERAGCSEVPIVEREEIRGVLSLRDLNAWLTRELRLQVSGALAASKALGLARRGHSTKN